MIPSQKKFSKRDLLVEESYGALTKVSAAQDTFFTWAVGGVVSTPVAYPNLCYQAGALLSRLDYAVMRVFRFVQ